MLESILLVLCLIICFFGVIGIFKEQKYKKDTETVQKIVDYFKREGKDGVEPKRLPQEILKTGYITWMLKDKTIEYKDGKYFLVEE